MDEIENKLLELSQHKNLDSMTWQEIAVAVGLKHAQSAKYHLQKLSKKGVVTLNQRGRPVMKVRAAEQVEDLIYLPIVGAASCGSASTFAEEDIQGYLPVSPSILRNLNESDLCVIRAAGDSMNNANINGKVINSGDYIIINTANKSPEDGDYVLSIIGGYANVKKFDHQVNAIALISESSHDYPPIYIHENDFENYMVGGVVLDVINVK